jgi:hypothetical protein
VRVRVGLGPKVGVPASVGGKVALAVGVNVKVGSGEGVLSVTSVTAGAVSLGSCVGAAVSVGNAGGVALITTGWSTGVSSHEPGTPLPLQAANPENSSNTTNPETDQPRIDTLFMKKFILQLYERSGYPHLQSTCKLYCHKFTFS